MPSINTEEITAEQMWAIPAQEHDEGRSTARPLVSVLMLAYNHADYIEQAIQSIVTQKCLGFQFELLIGEDCSTDNTLKVCEELQQQYPQLIRLITSPENVGMHRNFSRLWVRARGRYIAFCEGDDYWVDSHKLTKQVKVLESDPECNLCGTYTQSIRQDELGQWNDAEIIFPLETKDRYVFEDLIPRYNFHFSSVMIRKDSVKFPSWFWEVYCVDRPLYLLATQDGVARLIPEITSIYRHHMGGGWSPLSCQIKADKSVHLFLIMAHCFNTKHTKSFKKTLGGILYSYMSNAIKNKQIRIAQSLFAESLKHFPPSTIREYWLSLKIFLFLYFKAPIIILFSMSS